MPLEPGVYYLLNVKSGTVLDLSGRNRKSIIGFKRHGGKNQQWEFGKLGDRGWFIKSLHSSNSHFLTIENGLGDNFPVVANEYPVAWEVEHEENEGENVYWIHWPKTRFTVDLHQGNPANETTVNLWGRWGGARHQLWQFIPVRGSDRDQSTSTIMESNGLGTTTTTTTTVTTTTTTVVTKRNILTGTQDNH